jgi:sRNA-binding carbon storage regulator CsrA
MHDIQYDEDGREIGALTMTRKVGEKIHIKTGNGIVTIKLSRVGEGAARITVVAPKSMAITRPTKEQADGKSETPASD